MSMPYYKRKGIEVFDVIEAFELGFNLGNVMKYICRCDKKSRDGMEDLLKAKAYLEREIRNRERENVQDDLKGFAAREIQ